MSGFIESDLEEAALSYFEELDYTILHGPDIASGKPNAIREMALTEYATPPTSLRTA